ncbi:MAG: putative transposase [Streptomycetaceae bacterium]|nr:putative transposase [Streptomycetaceae bacterium]
MKRFPNATVYATEGTIEVMREQAGKGRQQMGTHQDAALVGASIRMAATTRGGTVDGVIFHSDRGSEHTSEAFNHLCDRLGVVQSMGRLGSALGQRRRGELRLADKVEYIHRHRFGTRAEARIKIATWVTGFYNTRRRHSAAGALRLVP